MNRFHSVAKIQVTSILFSAVLVVLLLSALPMTAQAQATWDGPVSISFSGARNAGNTIAYDPSQGVVIHYDGTAGNGRTYFWDGNNWLRDSPPIVPIGTTSGYSLAYANGNVYTFGGFLESPVEPDRHPSGLSYYDFSPSQNKWQFITPATSTEPPGRESAGLVYDEKNNRLLVFGGSASTDLNDMWEFRFSDNTWNQLSPGGAVPYAGSGQRMAYDPFHEQIVLTGGQTLANPGTVFETYIYDVNTNTWTGLNPATVPLEERYVFYSTIRKRVVAVSSNATGGGNLEVFEWNPWTQNWSSDKTVYPASVSVFFEGGFTENQDGFFGLTASLSQSPEYYQLTNIPPNTEPDITHTQITSADANADLNVSATIVDPDGDDLLSGHPILYYRTGTGGAFTSVQMSNISGDIYEGTIPAATMQIGTVQYYIEATDFYNQQANAGTSASPFSVASISAGSLQVSIDPAAVRSLGGRWSINGGSTWFTHNQTAAGIDTGNYTLQFDNVSGWDTPANENITINQNQLTATSGAYVQQTGTITVTISPQDAIDAGAQWSIDSGSTWFDSGQTETVPIGNYTVTFKSLEFYDSPANKNVSVAKDEAKSETGTYIVHTGNLTVTQTPQGAIDAGAQWSIDGGTTWNNSGVTLSNILGGNYTLQFNDVVDYDPPANQAITITKNANVEKTGIYTVAQDTITINIAPAEAVSDGAQWRLTSDGVWRNSGETATVDVGNYTVEFSEVTYWDTPANIPVTLQEGSPFSSTGTYVRQTGNLTVTILPQAAITNGAQWSIDGGSTWHNSGTTLSNIDAGMYTLTFKDATEFFTPVQRNVEVTKGADLQESVTYTNFTGHITVNIVPQAAVDAGAQWSADSGNTWNDSGTRLELPTDSYAITFRDDSSVPFWNPPADIDVTLNKDDDLSFDGTYVQQTGNLTVTLLPQGAVNNGAQWSIDGGTTWNDSGNTLSGIDAGAYTVTFQDATNFFTPGPLDITLTKNANLQQEVTYGSHTGTLKVNITPEESNEAGALFSVDGGATWHADGTSLTLPVGNYTVSFFDLTGWTEPDLIAATIARDSSQTLNGVYVKQIGGIQVTILADDAEFPAPANRVTDAGAQWRLTSDGIWRNSGDTASGLQIGEYIVEFKAVPGWSKPDTRRVTVLENDLLKIQEAYIEGTTSVSGRVVDDRGNFLWDATVNVTTGPRTLSHVLTPGDEGQYVFDGLPANRIYIVSVVKRDYVFRPSERTRAASGDTVPFPDFVGTFDPSDFSISGSVLSTGGAGVSEMVLSLNGGEQTTTDESGAFIFEGIPKGDYTVELLPKDGYIVESPFQDISIGKESVSGIQFNVGSTDLSISGNVFNLDASSGISGVVISLNGPISRQSITDATGRFRFNNLPSGDYSIVADESNFDFRVKRIKVSLTDFDLDNNDFIVEPPVLEELSVGGLLVYADRIEQRSFNEFFATGNVYIGRSRMARSEVDLNLDRIAGIIEGTGKLYAPVIPKIGGIEFFNGPFRGVNGNFGEITAEKELNLLFLKMTLSGLAIQNPALELSVTFELDVTVASFEVEVVVEVTKDSTELKSFDVSLPDVDLGKWKLENMNVTYDRDEGAFGGGAKVVTPLVGIDGSLRIVRGALDAINLSLSGKIPIKPPVFYLTRIDGGVSNLVTDEPIQIDAGAQFKVGRQIGKKHPVTLDVSLKLDLSGSFSAKGSIKLFEKIDAGWGAINYNHTPDQRLGASVGFSIGSVPKLEFRGDLNAAFRDFNMWGSANVKLIVDIDFKFWTERIVVADAGGAFTKDRLRVWAGILDARAEGIVDGNGFRVTKPGWLKFIKISFDEEGDDGSNIARAVLTANNQDRHVVSPDLGEAHFLIAWEKGSTQPKLTSPSGIVFDGSDNGFAYNYQLEAGSRFASFLVFNPEPGEWKVTFTNKKRIGRFLTELTEYGPQPGVAIASVEDIGTNQFRITLNRSMIDGEQVELFISPTNDPDQLIQIAGSEEVAEAMVYDWLANSVNPGTYQLVARIYDDENHPYLYRHEEPISVDGSELPTIDGQVAAKVRSNGVLIKWNSAASEAVSLYRVFFSAEGKPGVTGGFVDVPAQSSRVLLDAETMPPGFRYAIAVAAIAQDDRVGPMSKTNRFTYRSKKLNNLPHFKGSAVESVAVGKKYRYAPRTLDFDKDTLTFVLLEGPKGMKINQQTGVIEWTTEVEDAGLHPVSIQVSDGNGGTQTREFDLFVRDPSQKGLLSVRPVRDVHGKKAFVVTYWNPHMNEDRRKLDRIPAVVSTAAAPAGLPINLRESGPDRSYFSALVSAGQIAQAQRIARESASVAGVSPSAVQVNTLVVRLPGRTEKASARTR